MPFIYRVTEHYTDRSVLVIYLNGEKLELSGPVRPWYLP